MNRADQTPYAPTPYFLATNGHIVSSEMSLSRENQLVPIDFNDIETHWSGIQAEQTMAVLSVNDSNGYEPEPYIPEPSVKKSPGRKRKGPGAGGSGSGKRGRPTTSPRTLARNFPPVEEIQVKLDSGECFLRQRRGALSTCWLLFQEVAYTNTHEFTGIARCKNCGHMTRYHGQITGTSHMKKHPCFRELYPDYYYSNHQTTIKAETISNDSDDDPSPDYAPQLLSLPGPSVKKKPGPKSKTITNQKAIVYPAVKITDENINENFTDVYDAETQLFINYMTCRRCKLLVKYDMRELRSHVCRQRDINSPSMVGDTLIFRNKPKGRMTPIWEQFEEVFDPNTEQILGYARCKLCKGIIRVADPKSIPKKLRAHFCDEMTEPHPQAPPRTRNLVPTPKPELKKSIPSSTVTITPATRTAYFGKSSVNLVEKFVEFCYTELVSIETVTSDSFFQLANCLVKLCNQSTAKLSSILPDQEKLMQIIKTTYSSTKDEVKKHVKTALRINIGNTIVCDSSEDYCILSLRYIDDDWQIQESILNATMMYNHESFIRSTLEDYEMNQNDILAKFTFISFGGSFSGVNYSLTSMSHKIEKIIDGTVFDEKHFSFNEVYESCKVICHELKLPFQTHKIDWINKYEAMHQVIENINKFELTNSNLDLELVKSLVALLTPFKAASLELRQDNKPTLNHVLLWFHKLIKALADDDNSEDQLAGLKKVIKRELEDNFQIEMLHKIATFLWPNFRLLKMMTQDERERVHTEIRYLIENDTTISDGYVVPKKTTQNDFGEWEVDNDNYKDEVSKYLSVQLTTCTDRNILTWWREHASDFPKLSHLAKWILAIPASVTLFERYKMTTGQRVNEDLLFLHCNLPFRSSLVMDKSVKTCWKKKMELKQQLKNTKELDSQIKAAKQKKLEDKKRRTEENRKRREENARKSEVVQVIKNPKKLKRLAKKKMKKIRKA